MIIFRQVNIKNLQHYFFNSMTKIKHFDPGLLSIDKIPFKINDDVIYDIGYLTMEILDSSISLYLIFNNVDGYIECNSTEESNEDKYLIFASTGKNKKAFKKHTELWHD